MNSFKKAIKTLTITAIVAIPFHSLTYAQDKVEQSSLEPQTELSQSLETDNTVYKKGKSIKDLTQALGNKTIILALINNNDHGLSQLETEQDQIESKNKSVVNNSNSMNALKALEEEQNNDIVVIRLYTNSTNVAYNQRMSPNMEGPTILKSPENDQEESVEKMNEDTIENGVIENESAQQQNQTTDKVDQPQVIVAKNKQMKEECTFLIIDKDQNVHSSNFDQDSNVEHIKQEIKQIQENKQTKKTQNNNVNTTEILDENDNI